MYINAVMFGVLATLFVEMAVGVAFTLYCNVKSRAHDKNRKGGKNNG